MSKIKYFAGKTIYYKDELNDDFGTYEIGEVDLKLDKNFDYNRGNKFKRFFENALYFGIVRPILGIFTCLEGIKIKGKENIKEYKALCKKNKTGGFIYGNHVSSSDIFLVQTRILKTSYSNLVGFPNMLKKKGLKHLLLWLGYLPLGDDFVNQKKLIVEMGVRLKRKENIIIFPEAHIRKYYTEIRPFLDSSFYYPAKYNVPVLPFRTLFIKRKFFKKPRRIVVVGKPIMPNKDLTLKENKTYLRDYTYQTMLKLSEGYENKIQEYVKYVKIEADEIEKK